MDCSSNRLLGLPTELFEAVIRHLEAEQISWLRLTCKGLQGRVHHRFRPRFNTRQTDLSSNSLQRLIDISSHPDLGSVVQNLTIVSATYDATYLSDFMKRGKVLHGSVVERDSTEDELAQAKWEHCVLAQRQSEQASSEEPRLDLMMLTIAFSQLKTLGTLTLETAVYKMAAMRLQAHTCTEWGQPWRQALYVYTLVMTAFLQSHLAVQEFKVFGGHWGGSIPTASVTGSMGSSGFQDAFGGLERLSLCISPQSLPVGDTRSPNFSIAQKDYMGTAKLLQLCPKLGSMFTNYMGP